MNDFIDWMEQEYGEFGAGLVLALMAVSAISAFVAIIAITNGIALLAIPAYLAWVVYRYITRETEE